MPGDPTSTESRRLIPAYDFGTGRGIETDEPLPFRRETFAADLDDHARLLDRFLEVGAFEGREVLSVPGCGEILAALVTRNSSGEIGHLFPFRCAVVRSTDRYRGVTRELYAAPRESSHLPVVVGTPGAISLHLVDVHLRPSGAPRLEVLERDIVFEPLRQEHWHSGTRVITRWSALGADEEPRYAWVPWRGGPANETELIERLVALYEKRICREVRALLDGGCPVHKATALMESNLTKGNFMACFARGPAGDAHYDPSRFPIVARAIKSAGPGLIPLAVVTEHYAGVRWLRIGPDGTPRLDDTPAVVAQAIEEVDPDETARFLGAPFDLGPGHAGLQDFERVLDRLVTLSRAQLDAELVLAGFEPEVERGRGPGLRKSVVQAIAARQSSGDWTAEELQRAL